MITYRRRDEAVRAVGEHVRLPERPRLIVVDNGSDDGTADAIAEDHPSIEILRLVHNMGAAARNLGVQTAGTPYVAFSDDDSWWEPGALARAVEMLDRHPTVAAVTGRTLVGDSAVEDPLNDELAASPLERRPHLPGPRVLGFLACATVVRSAAFLDIGGFNGRMLIGGEEEILATDLTGAGWDIVYVDSVVVRHHPSRARSGPARRRIGIRNTLWFLWLRRPLFSVVRRMAHLARTLPRDRVTVAAIGDAVRGAPWVLRAREVVAPPIERELRLLDETQMRSRARRYVS